MRNKLFELKSVNVKRKTQFCFQYHKKEVGSNISQTRFYGRFVFCAKLKRKQTYFLFSLEIKDITMLINNASSLRDIKIRRKKRKISIACWFNFVLVYGKRYGPIVFSADGSVK